MAYPAPPASPGSSFGQGVPVRHLVTRSGRLLIARLYEAFSGHLAAAERTSAATKIGLRSLYLGYRQRALDGRPLPPVWDTGFRVFSQFDEDGVVLFLLGVVGPGTRRFVDVGGGDGLHASNCANLALNLGYHGVFIDRDMSLIDRGRRFYAAHPDTRLFPPRFVHATVTKTNVNDVIRTAGIDGDVDLLSIDIDGNDYWIWEAIDCVSPRIVVIETHVEFGERSIVVPYDETFTWHPGRPPHYLGASPAAMTKLARRRGYRLVGANRFGFNVFYVREDVAGPLPEVTVSDLFRHDRNRERVKRFDDIQHLKFEVV